MIGLSKSTLDLFIRCPRCFWLSKMKKLKPPEGIKASITSGMDSCMKAYVEMCAIGTVPCAYLEGFDDVQIYPNQAIASRFQSWQKFQAVVEVEGIQIKAWGGLDNMLLHKDGAVSAWDFKSKGKPPEPGYSEKYYQTQADMCHLLLEAQIVNGDNTFKCSGRQYFTYKYPVVIQGGAMVFNHHTHWIESDPERAKKLLHRAVLCLEGPMPASTEDCEICCYVADRHAIVKSI